MKMTNIEKRFVNRKRKAERNIQKMKAVLQQIDINNINTVVELGCGIGFVSTYLADSHKFVVYGTDYDSEQVQLAKKLQPKMEHLHFQVEDATTLSFNDSSIDLVISQNVFHHIPQWENAIQEIVRILRPGGYFIWLDLTFSAIVKKIFKPFVKNYGLYTFNDIYTAFEHNGFTQLSHEHSLHGLFSQHQFVLQLS